MIRLSTFNASTLTATKNKMAFYEDDEYAEMLLAQEYEHYQDEAKHWNPDWMEAYS